MKDYISNQDMADYLNRALNSDIVKKIISSSSTCGESCDVFSKIGNILEKYYISTMDNTLEGVNLVCNLFIEKYFTDSNFDYEFTNLLINKCAGTDKLKQKISIKDKINIMQLIYERNVKNRFFTHCFPGVLFEKISNEGLNINNEMFKEELSILEKYFKTPYKVGKLCYCEFSEASLSYAGFSVPERIGHVIGGIRREIIKESKYDLYKSSLEENLKVLIQKGMITKEEFEEVYMAGRKIIDCYCKNNDSCIAIFKVKTTLESLENKVVKYLNINVGRLKGTFIGNKIEDLIKECKKTPLEYATILEKGIIELENNFPEFNNIIENIIEKGLCDCMTTHALANYKHGGYADGYEIESGRLAREMFSIVKCACPTDLWLSNKNNELMKIILDENKKTTNDNSYDLNLQQLLQISRNLENIIKSKNNPEQIELIQLDKLSIIICLSENNIEFPNNYLIENTNKNFIISKFSKKMLEAKCISKIEEDVKDNNLINQIVNKYKETSNFNAEYDTDLEELKSDAIYWYSQNIFSTYDENKREEMIRKMALQNEVINISFEKEGYLVKTNNSITSIPRNILVNVYGEAPYNNLYFQMLEEKKNTITK